MRSCVAARGSEDNWEWEDADEVTEVEGVTEPSEDDVYADAIAVDDSDRLAISTRCARVSPANTYNSRATQGTGGERSEEYRRGRGTIEMGCAASSEGGTHQFISGWNVQALVTRRADSSPQWRRKKWAGGRPGC